MIGSGSLVELLRASQAPSNMTDCALEYVWRDKEFMASTGQQSFGIYEEDHLCPCSDRLNQRRTDRLQRTNQDHARGNQFAAEGRRTCDGLHNFSASCQLRQLNVDLGT